MESKTVIKGGYYLKARQIRESEIASAPPCTREIWDYLLREANHQNLKSNGRLIRRGQLVRSISQIRNSLSWKVGYRHEYYPRAACENALRRLRKQGMITTTITGRGIIITVCNYDTYQNPKNYDNRAEPHDNRTDNRAEIRTITEQTIPQSIEKQGDCDNKKSTITEQKSARLPRRLPSEKQCIKEKNLNTTCSKQNSGLNFPVFDETKVLPFVFVDPLPEKVDAGLTRLPLNDGTEFSATKSQAREWASLYPAVDLQQAFREMRGWLLANPRKKKTRRGIESFINAWLSRNQDRGGDRSRFSKTNGQLSQAGNRDSCPDCHAYIHPGENHQCPRAAS